MNTNPLTLLIDVIPPAHRRLVYALLGLLAFLWGIWQATDGDWGAFVAAIIGALVSALATANTPAAVLDPAGGDAEPDDGLSYEDAGGQVYPSDPADALSPTPENSRLYESGEPPAYDVTDPGNYTQTAPEDDVSGNPYDKRPDQF